MAGKSPRRVLATGLMKLQQASSYKPVVSALHRGPVHLFDGVTYRRYPGARIRGAGKLLVGIPWPGLACELGSFTLLPDATVDVAGRFACVSGSHVVVQPGAYLQLASGYINSGTRISCFEHVAIGQDAHIAERVTIRDSDNHSLGTGPTAAPIRIGDRVWIGLGATVLKGVTIGDGAVVAAGSVVVDDVLPPHWWRESLPGSSVRGSGGPDPGRVPTSWRAG